jgi:hypothetical protein
VLVLTCATKLVQVLLLLCSGLLCLLILLTLGKARCHMCCTTHVTEAPHDATLALAILYYCLKLVKEECFGQKKWGLPGCVCTNWKVYVDKDYVDYVNYVD